MRKLTYLSERNIALEWYTVCKVFHTMYTILPSELAMSHEDGSAVTL